MLNNKTREQLISESAERLKAYQKDIFEFILDAWKLKPQRPKPQFEQLLLNCRKKWDYDEMTLDMFEPYFRYRHLTWQQVEFFTSINDAINGRWPKKITVRSWHGIWKTWALSMLLLRWLCCFKDAQIPCTAPTQSQIRDVLWKEVAKRLARMPERFSEQLIYTSDYIRCSAAPKERFARARTWWKDSPEALAWVHWPFVMLLIDEASWVFEEVFEVAQGALTNENTLMVMISNPTRLTWYFYDSHTKNRKTFRSLHFDSEQSPIVTWDFVSSLLSEYWEDSDEYNIRVKWQFPNSEAVDDEWYVPLFHVSDVRQVVAYDFTDNLCLGIDPAGEWDDETVRVVRDQFLAKVIAREKLSSGKSIAQKTAEIIWDLGILDQNVIIDDFWVGSDCVKELAFLGYNVYNLYVWAPSEDNKAYLNKRAELYYKAKQWLKAGGQLVRHEWWKELFTIKYRRNEQRNVIQIMPKLEMKKKYKQKSPNVADAFMLTFAADLSREGLKPLSPSWV